jgi:hypothetical protein
MKNHYQSQYEEQVFVSMDRMDSYGIENSTLAE